MRAFLNPRENVDTADWLHLTDGEEVHWAGRPSRFTIVVSLVIAAVLVAIGIGLSAWLTPVARARDLPTWVALSPLLLAALGVAWGAITYLNWLRLLYVVTDEEIYVKHGLISRDVTQVRLDRIQNTSYNQSVLERFLSYGDVEIYTAGTSTEDIVFRSVPNPERVKRILTHLLSEQARRANTRVI